MWKQGLSWAALLAGPAGFAHVVLPEPAARLDVIESGAAGHQY